MRPTPAEELSAIVRILEVAVAPAVSDEYAATQLRQAIDGLNHLGADWERALPALMAECDDLERVLESLAAVVQVDLTALRPYTGGTEFGAMNARQQSLRAALDRALRDLDAAGDSGQVRRARASVATFLRNSADHWKM